MSVRQTRARRPASVAQRDIRGCAPAPSRGVLAVVPQRGGEEHERLSRGERARVAIRVEALEERLTLLAEGRRERARGRLARARRRQAAARYVRRERVRPCQLSPSDGRRRRAVGYARRRRRRRRWRRWRSGCGRRARRRVDRGGWLRDLFLCGGLRRRQCGGLELRAQRVERGAIARKTARATNALERLPGLAERVKRKPAVRQNRAPTPARDSRVCE